MAGNNGKKRNELCKPIAEDIFEKLSQEQTVDNNYFPFGDGHSADKIVRAMETRTKGRKKL